MDMFGKKILVVAAHPDDEILGCGATLAKFIRAGKIVTLLLLGEGPMARGADDAQREKAVTSARAAARQLGISDVRFSNLPDNRFDTLPLLSIIRLIEEAADDVLPDTVLTHHAGDLNIDHQRTHQAVMTAFRPLPTQKPVLLLGFEVLSSTDYTPSGTFVRPNCALTFPIRLLKSSAPWQSIVKKCVRGPIHAVMKLWNIWPGCVGRMWDWKRRKDLFCIDILSKFRRKYS